MFSGEIRSSWFELRCSQERRHVLRGSQMVSGTPLSSPYSYVNTGTHSTERDERRRSFHHRGSTLEN